MHEKCILQKTIEQRVRVFPDSGQVQVQQSQVGVMWLEIYERSSFWVKSKIRTQ